MVALERRRRGREGFGPLQLQYWEALQLGTALCLPHFPFHSTIGFPQGPSQSSILDACTAENSPCRISHIVKTRGLGFACCGGYERSQLASSRYLVTVVGLRRAWLYPMPPLLPALSPSRTCSCVSAEGAPHSDFSLVAAEQPREIIHLIFNITGLHC